MPPKVKNERVLKGEPPPKRRVPLLDPGDHPPKDKVEEVYAKMQGRRPRTERSLQRVAPEVGGYAMGTYADGQPYIVNTGSGKVLKLQRKVYYRVALRVRGTTTPRLYLLHTLAARHFHGAPEDERQVVNHKNGDSEDNRKTNLEWVTRSENARERKGVRGYTLTNVSGYPRYKAQATVKGETKYFGTWNTPQKAQEATKRGLTALGATRRIEWAKPVPIYRVEELVAAG